MTTQTQEQELLEELLCRRGARRDFETCYTTIFGFRPAPHHRLFMEYFQKLADGEIERLIVEAPPGSAKSTIASVFFVVWLLAHRPQISIILACHTMDLGERWGRKIRDLIATYGTRLGIALRPDSMAAGRLSTMQGGEVLVIGVGGALMGLRADVIICDDLLRSLEDANSPTVRRGLIDWFEASLRTRLKPGGRIAIIGTRLHEGDHIGYLLDKAQRGGEPWTEVRVPAVAEEGDILGRAPGQYLWDDDPDWKYGDLLRKEKQAQSPRIWAALYQQRPAPETGVFFEAQWFRPIDKLPPLEELRTYGASDFAVTSGGGDFSVHVVCGLDPENRLYVCDLWRGQVTPDKAVERMLDLAARWRPMMWGEESGQIRSSLGPFIDRRAHERRVAVFRKSFPSRHDKAIRAQSIRARMATDGLYVDMRAHYWPVMQQELLTFPGAKHDDIVDSLSLIGQMIADMVPGQRRKPPPPKSHVDDYSELPIGSLAQRPGEDWTDWRWRELQAEERTSDVLLM